MTEGDKDLEKYIRIKALADAGMSGERDNALRALHRLEEKLPGIRRRYEAWLIAQQPEPEQVHRAWQPESGGPPPPPAYDPQDVHGGRSRFDWETVGRWAQTAASSAYQFAETVGQALYGRQLAQNVTLSTQVTSRNNVLISFRMTYEVYEDASNLGVVQKNAFRRYLHEQLDAELGRILATEED